jgi:general stress protein 26
MKVLPRVLVVILVLSAPIQLFSQITKGDTVTRAQIITVSKEIMQTAGFCTLVTIGPDGQPQARVIDPFVPDSDLTIFFATNPLTRKVQDIRRDPRVTLLYFSAATHEYVTVIGKAVIDTDSLHKAGHWKEAWASMYKNQNRGEDYMLLRVTPSRLEVVSYRRGMRNDPKTGRPVILDLLK